MRDANRFVALAAITQPHGVHGRVKLKLFSDSTDNLKTLSRHLIRENGSPVTLKVTGEAGGAPVASIAEIKNRNDAELWRGAVLGVMREHLPETTDDEFYVDDLIGLKLLTESGDAYGTITAIENYGAGDIVVITATSGDEIMLPLTHTTFPSFDIASGTGMVYPPEILPTGDEPRE